MASRSTPRLEIRQAKLKDVREIGELVRRAYDDLPAYTQGEIRGQINNYPEGCFVALFDGAVVGYCASMRLDERVALSDHTWDEVTGNGFGSRHDPTGDWLYGYELCVDPAVRGTRLGRRLYEERRALAERLDHHPEIHNSWNRVTLRLCTHDAGGQITEKDLTLARAIQSISLP